MASVLRQAGSGQMILWVRVRICESQPRWVLLASTVILVYRAGSLHDKSTETPNPTKSIHHNPNWLMGECYVTLMMFICSNPAPGSAVKGIPDSFQGHGGQIN